MTVRGVAMAVAAILLLAGPGGRAQAGAAELPTDYEVKAAFLYNFAKFVHWPEEALSGPMFVVAIVGDDPFGSVLDRAFAGKTVQGHPVEVRRGPAREFAAAQIVFVGASERAHLGETLAAFKNTSTLTVGDMDRFADGGGMVGFRTKDSTVRFEINLREVRLARLQMSSQLLRLAQRVIGDGA